MSGFVQYRHRHCFISLLWVALCVSVATAQQGGSSDASGASSQPAPASSSGQDAGDQDPLKRPPTEKQKKLNSKALRQELGRSYKKWLDEDVRWIITDQERQA
jgi:hypothetical protein